MNSGSSRSARHVVESRSLCMAIIALVGIGCGAKQISYSPSLRFSLDDARAIVERTIEEQHPAYRPTTVEVTNEKVDAVFHRRGSKFARALTWPFASAAGSTDAVTIYFDDLMEPRLFRKRSYYIMILQSGAGIPLKVYCRNRARAERFMDALAVLKKKSTQ